MATGVYNVPGISVLHPPTLLSPNPNRRPFAGLCLSSRPGSPHLFTSSGDPRVLRSRDLQNPPMFNFTGIGIDISLLKAVAS
jgi:hypothetical protein